MTLEEAIKHAEDKAQCGGQCGEEHAQLARWLKELQELRAAQPEKRTEERTKTHACDPIDRWAALDCVSNSLVAWEAYEAIEALPAAEPEPQWIPCAERMPKSGEPVLITYRTWRSYLRKYVYFVTIGWHANRYSVREDSFSEWEDDCDYDEDGDVFYIREGWYEFTTQGNCDHASWGICDAEVTAWMPLPKPYGGEQDGSD